MVDAGLAEEIGGETSSRAPIPTPVWEAGSENRLHAPPMVPLPRSLPRHQPVQHRRLLLYFFHLLMPPPPRCSVSRFAPTAVLVFGLVAFCGGLAIVTFRLRPEALSNMNNATVATNTSSGLPLPTPAAATMAHAYAAAVLMGVGDACANTVMLTRLGVLSDDVKLIPRTTAFQFFQCVNVLMTCASFLYAPALPLDQSVAQVIVLLTLAVFGGACFGCAGIPPKRASAHT